MIYTITLNPAVDLVMQLPTFTTGALNRVPQQTFVAGGKGINISLLLSHIDVPSVATGFLGGFTGQFVKDSLASKNIKTYFVEVSEPTRVNIKLRSETETEINGSGPHITSPQFKELLAYWTAHITAEDTVFLSGNVAAGITEEQFTLIAKTINQLGARLVVDTNRQLLTSVLPYNPFLIKPNHIELGEIFGETLESQEAILTYAKKLQDMGAQNVLVSCGGNGSVLVTETDDVYRANVPSGQLMNSAGAGDSMLAGFMAEYLTTKDPQRALRFAAAAGSATAYSTGIATVEKIESLIDEVQVTHDQTSA